MKLLFITLILSVLGFCALTYMIVDVVIGVVTEQKKSPLMEIPATAETLIIFMISHIVIIIATYLLAIRFLDTKIEEEEKINL